MLISAIVLCIFNNLSPTWHRFHGLSSLPGCDCACVMRAQLPRLLLDPLPKNTTWCFWQACLTCLCKAETGEPGIKGAWWRGKKENDWERTQTSLTCKAASVVWPRWVPRQEGGGEITVLVLALLVMLSEVCAHTERFGHVNNWVISPHVVYAFHVVSSFSSSINIMLLGLLYTCTKIQRDK